MRLITSKIRYVSMYVHVCMYVHACMHVAMYVHYSMCDRYARILCTYTIHANYFISLVMTISTVIYNIWLTKLIKFFYIVNIWLAIE